MTEQTLQIHVVSTFAEDRYFFTVDETQKIKMGGPAFWITETLKELSVPSAVTTGPQDAVVNITVEKDNEHGQIVSLSHIAETPPDHADAFIISTIRDEFDLVKIANLRGIIALDVQGYVRSSRMEGDEICKFPDIVTKHIDILKANKAELEMLDPQFIADQQNRILLVTRGSEGFEFYVSGARIFFPGNCVTAPDTVGAGDVVLTAFLVSYLKSRDPLQSAIFAREYVEKFLVKKVALFRNEATD